MFYLYRFINKDQEVIYIGRTNDIKRRILKEHFTEKTHLQPQCYLEVAEIEYTKMNYHYLHNCLEVVVSFLSKQLAV